MIVSIPIWVAPDRGHRVDRLDPGLERFADRLAVGNAGSLLFDRTELRRRDRAFPVEGIAERVDHTAENRVADRHSEKFAGGADFVPFLNVQVIAEDDDADAVLFEVKRQPADTAGELEHFARHHAGQPVNLSDTVPHFDNAADLAHVNMGLKLFNFLLYY